MDTETGDDAGPGFLSSSHSAARAILVNQHKASDSHEELGRHHRGERLIREIDAVIQVVFVKVAETGKKGSIECEEQ